VMDRVNGDECGVSSSMTAGVFARSCVRKGEIGDLIGQLLESCCIVRFQSLHCFTGRFWNIVNNSGMKGVVDGLYKEDNELSNELFLIGCWCSAEKQRRLMVLDDWLDIR
jgi:hypothetical protein